MCCATQGRCYLARSWSFEYLGGYVVRAVGSRNMQNSTMWRKLLLGIQPASISAEREQQMYLQSSWLLRGGGKSLKDLCLQAFLVQDFH